MAVAALVVLAGCASPPAESPQAATPPRLVGSWSSKIQFTSGAFAGIKDLEFMYVFNLGGTMTESSNYDGAPPVPPAYGTWREVAPNQFEAQYEFFVTKAPVHVGEIIAGGGWTPAGRGRFVEHIDLAPDGKSYTSTLEYHAFDAAGKPAAGGGEARGQAARFGP